MSDIHPALIAALAANAAETRPTEGVRVRAACGFAPAQPFVAEVSKLTPVGVVTVTGYGPDPEAAVDAARAQVEDRIVEIAPAEVRERLKMPEHISSAIESVLERLLGGAEVISIDSDEIPEPLRQLLPGDDPEVN